MVETEDFFRVGTRVHAKLQVHSGRKCSGIAIMMMLYPFNDISCTCVSESYTPRMIRRLKARLRYSAAMRVAILLYRSRCLPFVLVLFSRPNRPVCSLALLPNLRRIILFLFCFSSSLRLFAPAQVSLPLLFRLIFCPRKRARTSIIASSACTIFVKFSFVKNSTCVQYLTKREKNTRKIFFTLKISNFLDFNINIFSIILIFYCQQ